MLLCLAAGDPAVVYGGITRRRRCGPIWPSCRSRVAPVSVVSAAPAARPVDHVGIAAAPARPIRFLPRSTVVSDWVEFEDLGQGGGTVVTDIVGANINVEVSERPVVHESTDKDGAAL